MYQSCARPFELKKKEKMEKSGFVCHRHFTYFDCIIMYRNTHVMQLINPTFLTSKSFHLAWLTGMLAPSLYRKSTESLIVLRAGQYLSLVPRLLRGGKRCMHAWVTIRFSGSTGNTITIYTICCYSMVYSRRPGIQGPVNTG